MLTGHIEFKYLFHKFLCRQKTYFKQHYSRLTKPLKQTIFINVPFSGYFRALGPSIHSLKMHIFITYVALLYIRSSNYADAKKGNLIFFLSGLQFLVIFVFINWTWRCNKLKRNHIVPKLLLVVF